MEELFSTTAAALNFLLQVIILIVFLVMARNVSKIKKAVATSSKSDYMNAINLAIFKADHPKARDLIYELLFRLLHSGDKTPSERIESFKKPIELLQTVDGDIPKDIADYIEKNQ